MRISLLKIVNYLSLFFKNIKFTQVIFFFDCKFKLLFTRIIESRKKLYQLQFGKLKCDKNVVN